MQRGEAPNPSEKFLRDSDVAKIYIFSPPNRQGHEAVRKMDELLSIDCWHKPPRALAGPRSTSVIRSSHHLEEKGNKKRRHDSPINSRRGIAFMFINVMSTRLHCARAA